jgi:hypothetical protein
MKKKEFEAIGKHLLPELPDFAAKGSLVFRTPVQSILQGLCFEGSDFNQKSFYISIFILPLFVPTKFVHFLFGNRLRINGADRWNANTPGMATQLSATIKREALPWFSHNRLLENIVCLAKAHPNPTDPHVQESIAYMQIRSGDIKQANVSLDQLVSVLRGDVPWQREMADRAKSLKSQLLTDPTAAQRQLDAWEAETVKNLGLEEFR